MDLETRLKILPCGKCEDMMDCDNCIFAKEAKELYKQIRAELLDEFLNSISESILWDILAEIMKRNIVASDGTDKIMDYLQKVAEQLKEQRNAKDI